MKDKNEEHIKAIQSVQDQVYKALDYLRQNQVVFASEVLTKIIRDIYLELPDVQSESY